MTKRKDMVDEGVVAQRLAIIASVQGLNGAQIGELLGSDAKAWSKYIHGKIEFPVRLARVLKAEFGVSLEWIYGYEKSHNQAAFNERLAAFEKSGRPVQGPQPGRGRPRRIPTPPAAPDKK